jgi:predicted RNA-binding protein YlxR (DUF448 family)
MKINKHHVPSRTCVTCGIKKPKNALLRIVLNKDGETEIDNNLNLPGRGAYVCKSKSCLSDSLSKAHLEYALRYTLGAKNWNLFKANVGNLTL